MAGRFATVAGVRLAFDVKIEVLHKHPPASHAEKMKRDSIDAKYWMASHAVETALAEIVDNISGDCTLEELAEWLIGSASERSINGKSRERNNRQIGS